MDTKTVIEVNVLKCALCDNYLTVPPVFCLNVEGDQYRCGRCKDVECKTYGRNFSYENVAEYLSFPCTYERCKEKILWGQAEEHEKICPYRTISCPMCSKCTETIQISELEPHFKQVHPESVFSVNVTKAVFSVRVAGACVCLLVKESQPYLLYVIITEDIFISVFSLSSHMYSSKFDVELTSDNNSCSIMCKNQDIVVFEEQQHCFKCLEEVCEEKHHPYSQWYNKVRKYLDINTAKFKLKSLLDILERPEELQFTITLMDKEIEQTEEVGKFEKADS